VLCIRRFKGTRVHVWDDSLLRPGVGKRADFISRSMLVPLTYYIAPKPMRQCKWHVTKHTHTYARLSSWRLLLDTDEKIVANKNNISKRGRLFNP